MNRWRAGCDETITVYVPRGYSYKAMSVRCGSTAFDGGVNQCEACAAKHGVPPLPYEDEGDMEHFERTSGGYGED
jgi:hypothetical protein